MAKFPVVYVKKAKKELIDTWSWYEEKQKGLGDTFLKDLLHHISLIEDNPESFAQYFKPYRQVPLKVFPYLIIFKVMKTQITVISIFHTSRNPNKRVK